MSVMSRISTCFAHSFARPISFTSSRVNSLHYYSVEFLHAPLFRCPIVSGVSSAYIAVDERLSSMRTFIPTMWLTRQELGCLASTRSPRCRIMTIRASTSTEDLASDAGAAGYSDTHALLLNNVSIDGPGYPSQPSMCPCPRQRRSRMVLVLFTTGCGARAKR
ncbi:hypothetical protein K503DRAFT_434389 [Rhizopogon vinicolor AM-OR11-026]|uniref:Uncharacterized protein n=1 Tax=Rhizopogon vinicolor AM-OR11-026 TaxID=1314800 RepID=A0A1B7MPT0_9AGAM|nr:hypothetical protein K503DRAFT_434389 [Rhizopogon vinicolor AM-OR11-026]